MKRLLCLYQVGKNGLIMRKHAIAQSVLLERWCKHRLFTPLAGDFLYNRWKERNGILQRFVEPKGTRNGEWVRIKT